MEAARPAVGDDLHEISVLDDLARAELGAKRGGDVHLLTVEPLSPGLQEALSDPDCLVLVGSIDGVTVGYAVARASGTETRIARLEALFVHPDARMVGVGAAMMDRILAWAEACGCSGVDSVALPGDRATKNFFESYGLVARAILVYRQLTE